MKLGWAIEIERLTAERDAAVASEATMRAVLERNRLGLANILEFRKLSKSIFDGSDGYGARYGALTREEVEAAISEIDIALASTQSAHLKKFKAEECVRAKRQGAAEAASLLEQTLGEWQNSVEHWEGSEREFYLQIEQIAAQLRDGDVALAQAAALDRTIKPE